GAGHAARARGGARGARPRRTARARRDPGRAQSHRGGHLRDLRGLRRADRATAPARTADGAALPPLRGGPNRRASRLAWASATSLFPRITRAVASDRNPAGSGTAFTSAPESEAIASRCPKPSLTTTLERSRLLVPSARLWKVSVARTKPSGWSASRAGGDSRETSATSDRPAVAFTSVIVSAGVRGAPRQLASDPPPAPRWAAG